MSGWSNHVLLGFSLSFNVGFLYLKKNDLMMLAFLVAHVTNLPLGK